MSITEFAHVVRGAPCFYSVLYHFTAKRGWWLHFRRFAGMGFRLILEDL